MMKYKIQPALELIERYKACTLDVIIEEWNVQNNDISISGLATGQRITGILTGFGSMDCILCKESYKYFKCTDCIHTVKPIEDPSRMVCLYGKSAPTYKAIQNAKSPKELFDAIQNRIKYIESLIKIAEKLNKQN